MVDALSSISTSYNDALLAFASKIGVSLETFIIIMSIISIWALVWKGFALWKSAKKNSVIWFVVLLVVNTMGILEILYIFVFSKITANSAKTLKKPSKK